MILETFELPVLEAQGANARLLAPDGAGSCTLWYRGEIPSLTGERLGIIGHYRADTPGAGSDILEAACEHLSAQGCTIAVGPMDGNTWRSYRFVTDGNENEPPFFLEPVNPHGYPLHWQTAAFEPLAQYSSALTDDLAVTDPRVEVVALRLAAMGVRLRSVDMGRVEEDLGAVHSLSLTSFEKNFLYTPLGLEEFIEQYRRILPFVRPELTVLAHDRDESLVGFIFALPDLNEHRRGDHPRTVIIKTVAVQPGRSWAGLGLLLVDRCQKAARDLGYMRVIHALMHDSNASRNISGAYSGRTIRRYTLFARRLAAAEQVP